MAYSPEFRAQVIEQMSALIAQGASVTDASEQVAATKNGPSAQSAARWYARAAGAAEDFHDSAEPPDTDDEQEIEYVDLDAFRAEAEAPLRAEIDRLRAVIEHMTGTDHARDLDAAVELITDLEQRNAQLTAELTRIRALVRHYLDTA